MKAIRRLTSLRINRKEAVFVKRSFVWAVFVIKIVRFLIFMEKIYGNIHSFESFGTVDGPGIRFVVFMQGCPMRCRYCHNPDTWQIGSGKKYSAREVAAEAMKYKSYIKNGGVTVSGGEPLLQAEFVTELFGLLKEKGIHTALDTSGITFSEANAEKYKKLLSVCDLVLLDIKHIDDEKHKSLTGFSNEAVLKFAQFVSDSGVDLWIRHVLVSGITDDDEYLFRLKKFISTLKTVKKVEVLPYHGMGEVKYDKLNIPYVLKGMQPPEKDRIENAKKILN